MKSDAKAAFGRAMDKTVEQAREEQGDLAHTSKFSMLLDNDMATMLDQLALTARRKLGRPVKKAEVLRGLIALTADDPTLCNQLVEELKSRKLDY